MEIERALPRIQPYACDFCPWGENGICKTVINRNHLALCIYMVPSYDRNSHASREDLVKSEVPVEENPMWVLINQFYNDIS